MTINVPDSWAEISLAQYMEIASIDKESNDRSLLVASILIDKDPEEIRQYDIQSFNKIIEAIGWCSNLPEENYKPVIKIADQEFGFINRLTDLTLGEWIDLEHYLQDYNNNIHKIAAILYRPLITAFNDRDRIVEPYDAKTAPARAELFEKEIMISEIYGALLFFSIIARECMQTIQDYFQSQIQMKISGESQTKKKLLDSGKKKKKSSDLINGIGTALFMPWQKVILQKLSRSPI